MNEKLKIKRGYQVVIDVANHYYESHQNDGICYNIKRIIKNIDFNSLKTKMDKKEKFSSGDYKLMAACLFFYIKQYEEMYNATLKGKYEEQNTGFICNNNDYECIYSILKYQDDDKTKKFVDCVKNFLTRSNPTIEDLDDAFISMNLNQGEDKIYKSTLRKLQLACHTEIQLALIEYCGFIKIKSLIFSLKEPCWSCEHAAPLQNWLEKGHRFISASLDNSPRSLDRAWLLQYRTFIPPMNRPIWITIKAEEAQ